MSEKTFRQTVAILQGMENAAGFAACDHYLDILAEVWGEGVAHALFAAVWG